MVLLRVTMYVLILSCVYVGFVGAYHRVPNYLRSKYSMRNSRTLNLTETCKYFKDTIDS